MRNQRKNDDNFETNSNQWNNGNYNHSSNFSNFEAVNEISCQLNPTRSQRIRTAMFPETLAESEVEANVSLNLNINTALQKLAEPAQMLKHAMANLINYQDDADLSTKAIPELIKLLNDEDQIVVAQTSMMINQLSKKEASRNALMNSSQ